MFRDYIRRLIPAAAALLVASCTAVQPLDSPMAGDEANAVPAAVERDYQQILEQLAAEEDSAAAASLERFIARYPDYPGAYTNLAIVYDRLSRQSDALRALDIAVSIDAGFAPAYNRIGVIKRREGDFVAAEQAWRAAIQADPDYALAWHNLGILHELYLGDSAAALQHYERYQALTPDAVDPLVARWIADLERRLGDTPRTARVGEQP
jgi:tetratricopeptide (TPR) repeat protein